MRKIVYWLLFLTIATWVVAWLCWHFLPGSIVSGVASVAGAACLIITGYTIIIDQRRALDNPLSKSTDEKLRTVVKWGGALIVCGVFALAVGLAVARNSESREMTIGLVFVLFTVGVFFSFAKQLFQAGRMLMIWIRKIWPKN